MSQLACPGCGGTDFGRVSQVTTEDHGTFLTHDGRPIYVVGCLPTPVGHPRMPQFSCSNSSCEFSQRNLSPRDLVPERRLRAVPE